jgi:hypothetical protein
MKGPVLNPEFYGIAKATSINIQVPNYVTEDIKPVPFNILMEGYEMTFGPVVTVSGAGSAVVNGLFRFEYWIPVNIGLDIIIPRESPIPYQLNIAGFQANGNSSGKLEINVSLNDSYVHVGGDLLVSSTEMSVNMENIPAEVFNESENPFYVAVELSLTSGSMVEFFWPNVNNPIIRVNPELGTKFYVSADTQAAHYSLISDIRIRSGELYYFDRSFFIRQGTLVFRENERQFNPMLSARAEIRDRSDTGPVTIAMVIDNQPLLSFVPRFESTPSMTQLEIYSILGQNLYNIQGSDMDMTQRLLLASSTEIVAQIVSTSDVLAQIIYFRQLERGLREFLNLDMLSIRTRFWQNAVVSSGSTMFGQPPVDRIYRVGNYFDNTTVFIGKYLGQDMFAQGTLTLRYDENRIAMGGLRLEPDIGIELHSPFINIRWEFFPYHPRNWWVNDNSITLTWGRSF